MRSRHIAAALVALLLAAPALAQTAPAPGSAGTDVQPSQPNPVQNPQAASPTAPLDCQRLPGNCQEPVTVPPGAISPPGMPAQSR